MSIILEGEWAIDDINNNNPIEDITEEPIELIAS